MLKKSGWNKIEESCDYGLGFLSSCWMWSALSSSKNSLWNWHIKSQVLLLCWAVEALPMRDGCELANSSFPLAPMQWGFCHLWFALLSSCVMSLRVEVVLFCSFLILTKERYVPCETSRSHCWALFFQDRVLTWIPHFSSFYSHGKRRGQVLFFSILRCRMRSTKGIRCSRSGMAWVVEPELTHLLQLTRSWFT